ncbi:hypothetical protein ACOMHN_024292 [Nucella lapillus]
MLLGMYTGSLNTLLNVLNVRFVGLAHLHCAFGVSLFLSGLGTISGPLVAADWEPSPDSWWLVSRRWLGDKEGMKACSWVDSELFLDRWFAGSLMLTASFLDLWAGTVLLRQNQAADVSASKEKI